MQLTQENAQCSKQKKTNKKLKGFFQSIRASEEILFTHSALSEKERIFRLIKYKVETNRKNSFVATRETIIALTQTSEKNFARNIDYWVKAKFIKFRKPKGRYAAVEYSLDTETFAVPYWGYPKNEPQIDGTSLQIDGTSLQIDGTSLQIEDEKLVTTCNDKEIKKPIVSFSKVSYQESLSNERLEEREMNGYKILEARMLTLFPEDKIRLQKTYSLIKKDGYKGKVISNVMAYLMKAYPDIRKEYDFTEPSKKREHSNLNSPDLKTDDEPITPEEAKKIEIAKKWCREHAALKKLGMDFDAQHNLAV